MNIGLYHNFNIFEEQKIITKDTLGNRTGERKNFVLYKVSICYSNCETRF